MKEWLVDLKKSWQDRTFLCSMIIFVLSYLLLAGLALLISQQLYLLLISGIAGWQVASWSHRLAPLVKAKLFKD